MMKQETLAGIVFCLMGISMLILPPGTLWRITEKWKTKGSGEPSRTYVVIMRILGIIFASVGGCFLIFE